MKLNKDTKHNVAIGDVLEFGDGSRYMITALSDSGKSIVVSITDTKDRRTIYGMPISKLYGAMIEKGDN